MKGTIEVIGLSISQCIRDVAMDLVPFASVARIVGGTAFEDFEELWQEYSTAFWQECLPQARQILFVLISQNRLDQPRLRGETPPDSGAGIWRIDDVAMNTPELRDLLSISDYFLQMSQGRRNHVLEYLPDHILEQFIRDSNQDHLRRLFPDLPEMVGKLPADDLYAMVVNRLKLFYHRATEVEKLVMHPHVIRILKPFLRHKMAKERARPKQKPAGPEGGTQIRPKSAIESVTPNSRENLVDEIDPPDPITPHRGKT